MRTPENIVRDFGRAWEARDPDAIIAALTEDIVYENVPIPAMRGHEEVRRFITPNLKKSSAIKFDFLCVAIAANGAVLTERIDTFYFGDKSVAVPLMGIFELRGEKIARWRDYADIGSFVRQMQAIGQAPGPGIV
ncbi:MAG: limonene-1,2-epoxide hydrolase family protein [Steroidobacteraceae bacterium]